MDKPKELRVGYIGQGRNHKDLYLQLKEEPLLALDIDFGIYPDMTKARYLDVYEDIYAEMVYASKFDEISDLSMMYLGQTDMTRNTRINHHLLEEEEKHLNRALSNCRYPTWALNRARININRNKKKNTRMQNTIKRTYIVVPYMKGLSETCKNICRRHGIDLHFKGNNTIRQLLVHPKDKDDILKKSGVIYRYKCDRVDCGEEYIGESGRTFAERFREHLKSPSPIYDHHKTTGHEASLDNFSIVGRDDQSMTRLIREAMLIRVNDPSLNRNIGKYQLPHIWDEVLVRSPEMHLS